MGRQDYSIVGTGMTENEARRDAIEADRDENGHQEGYNGGISSATGEECRVKCLTKPKPAKTCTVDKVVQQGARKWETVYVIAPVWDRGGYSPRKHAEVKTTQGDAIKKAKAMALEFNEEFSIIITKKLVTGTNTIATVRPKKATVGRWLFTGLARC